MVAVFLVPGLSGDHNPAMLLLVISLLALVGGPLLFRLADRAHWALMGLDGFIMVTVAGLVLMHVVPHSVEVAGPWALAMALAGFLGPGLIERHLHRAARSTHLAALLLACIGLLVHEFFDGVALGLPAAGHDDESSILAIAVVLHRLPVAVTVWWLLRPVLGAAAAAGTLAGLGLATVAGFAFAGTVAPLMEEAWTGFVQCLVAGSLLHVVVHRPPPLAPSPSAPAGSHRGNLYAGLGALLGVLAVAGISDGHEHPAGAPDGMHFGDSFVALALQIAPALLLGLLLAGASKALLAQGTRWLRPGRAVAEALRGIAFGWLVPLRAHGVASMYRSLLRGGVPLATALAFLAATPALALEAIAISLPLLGVELTVARVLAVVLLGLCVGATLGRLSHTSEPPAFEPAVTTRSSGGTRLRLALRIGLGDLVDDVGPWLLLGLVVAALAQPLIDRQWLALLPRGVDILVFTLLGLPLYLSAAGATPVAAMLVHEGVSPGAALAFLLVGPAVHLAVVRTLGRLHSRRVALTFTGAVAGLAALLGVLTNALIEQAHEPALHEAVPEAPGIVHQVCAIALAALVALSVLRLGPRGFVGLVLFPHGHEDGCDSECSEHDHDHGDAPGR
jgi:uncharacterized membrane protein YraQ (UPF0718 family)